MPKQFQSSGRTQVFAVAAVTLLLVAAGFAFHRVTSPSDHGLAPDLVFGVFAAAICMAGVVLWAKTMRS